MTAGDASTTRDFIRAHTRLQTPPLLPEVSLHLADEVMEIWGEAAALWGDDAIPFWAFAWPGGQAVARYVLDQRQMVAGRSVLDLGSGSGLCAIAAAVSAADSVLAVDIDPRSGVAVSMNAEANGVRVAFTGEDLLDGNPPHVDVILAGDLCYEREMAPRVRAWLEGATGAGVTVIIADPGRSYFQRDGLIQLATYDVPVLPYLEDRDVKHVGVYTFQAERSMR